MECSIHIQFDEPRRPFFLFLHSLIRRARQEFMKRIRYIENINFNGEDVNQQFMPSSWYQFRQLQVYDKN